MAPALSRPPPAEDPFDLLRPRNIYAIVLMTAVVFLTATAGGWLSPRTGTSAAAPTGTPATSAPAPPVTQTPSPTPLAAATPTRSEPVATATPTPSPTQLAAATPTTSAPVATATPAPSPTPLATATPAPSPTPLATPRSTPSATPAPIATVAQLAAAYRKAATVVNKANGAAFARWDRSKKTLTHAKGRAKAYAAADLAFIRAVQKIPWYGDYKALARRVLTPDNRRYVSCGSAMASKTWAAYNESWNEADTANMQASAASNELRIALGLPPVPLLGR